MPPRLRRPPCRFAGSFAVALALAGALPLQGTAQQLASVADTSPFRPLELPGPDSSGAAAGRPGPALLAAAGRLPDRRHARPRAERAPRPGRRCHYHNRSPDALPYLWLHLEQNMCGPGEPHHPARPAAAGLPGLRPSTSAARASPAASRSTRVLVGRVAATPVVYGTAMRLDLRAPLAPGRRLDAATSRGDSTVPPFGGGRMGHDGTLYELGQWYPRLAVYDDLRGWNHEPYIGAGEFYLEYGDFDVSLTVPGELRGGGHRDAAEPAGRCSRRPSGRASSARRDVGTRRSPSSRRTRPAHPPRAELSRATTLTWRFTADSVRDFAFAASPDFQWDASAWDGVMIHTLYRPSATLWAEANPSRGRRWRYYSQPVAAAIPGRNSRASRGRSRGWNTR